MANQDDETYETPTVDEPTAPPPPAPDPSAPQESPRDDEGNFISEGEPTPGVQPVEDADIPEAGR